MHITNKINAKCRKLIDIKSCKSVPDAGLMISRIKRLIPMTKPTAREAMAPWLLSRFKKIPKRNTAAMGGAIMA